MSSAPADSTGRRLSKLAGTIVKNTIVYGNSEIKLRNCMFDFYFMNMKAHDSKLLCITNYLAHFNMKSILRDLYTCSYVFASRVYFKLY